LGKWYPAPCQGYGEDVGSSVVDWKPDESKIKSMDSKQNNFNGEVVVIMTMVVVVLVVMMMVVIMMVIMW
jgi:cell division protein FtsL